MKNKISSMVLIATLMFWASCSESLDINQSPNSPSEVEATLVLPSAQMHIAGIVGGYFSIVGGIWSQHWTQSHVSSQYSAEDRYVITGADGDYGVAWRELYSDALIDLSRIIEEGHASGNHVMVLIGTSLRVYTLQMLVDFYDQLPYSEALQAETGVTQPKFDDGQNVYQGLLQELDDVLSLEFTGGGNEWVQTDFVFGDRGLDGQVRAWQQFVRTLQLKLWIRQTRVNDSGASAGINNLLSTNDFLKDGAEISVFVDVPNQSNPLYETNIRQLNTSTNLRASRTLLSWLMQNDDPRVDAYYNAGANGHFGLRQGDIDIPGSQLDGALVDVANIKATTPFYFFTKDEVSFLLAEAHLRYGDGNMAKDFYEAGILDACSRVDTDCSGLIQTAYAYPDADFDTNLEAILTQKWASLVERGYESFFDQNRTGIPKVSAVNSDEETYVPGQWTYSITGTTNGLFPKRLIFPDYSRRTNENTPSAVPLTEPVWWAK